MKREIAILFLVLFCTACGAVESAPAESPPESAEVLDESPLSQSAPETGDWVLLTLEAPLADGRTLTLEAVGRELDEYSCGVREVRVYQGDELLQTVLAAEGILRDCEDWYGEMAEYTFCWTAEETLEVLDLNFDGNTDFGLFGWVCNNSIPYHYWTWDGEAGQYRYTCTLQGAEVHPESGEVTAGYKGSEGRWTTDRFRLDERGELFLVGREIECGVPSPDADRSAWELWTPQEGVRIRPRPFAGDESGLVLMRREVPGIEICGSQVVSRFTEIWERQDGELRLTGTEEYNGEGELRLTGTEEYNSEGD